VLSIRALQICTAEESKVSSSPLTYRTVAGNNGGRVHVAVRRITDPHLFEQLFLDLQQLTVL
jgi:hypothetical protein